MKHGGNFERANKMDKFRENTISTSKSSMQSVVCVEFETKMRKMQGASREPHLEIVRTFQPITSY